MNYFDLNKEELQEELQSKYCTDFIIYGWARPSIKETYMVEYHDTKNVNSDTEECQMYLTDHLWEDITLDGLVWFCHHVTVTFSIDYWGESDADVDCSVISQKKCSSFGELRDTWLHIKQIEGID